MHTKKPVHFLFEPASEILSSGDRTRTCDLWVMSPTSYLLLHPAVYVLLLMSNRYSLKRRCKVISKKRNLQIFRQLFFHNYKLINIKWVKVK